MNRRFLDEIDRVNRIFSEKKVKEESQRMFIKNINKYTTRLVFFAWKEEKKALHEASFFVLE